jgi:ligand-binding sensor domain-containing protein/signal transduction histidine kinase
MLWFTMDFRLATLLALGASLLGARHLPVQVYTTAQGLPRNLVECMTFSPNGMLWLCTSEGLARFDGYHFQLFGPEQGLPVRRILDLVHSRQGGYWLVSGAGVCRLALGAKIGQPCRLLESDQKSSEIFIDTMLESNSGATWFSTGRALFRITSDGLRLESTTFVVPPNEQILMVADGLNGDLLVGTDFNLFAWKPGEKARLISQSVGAVGCQQSLRLASGELLIGATNGLFRLAGHGSDYSLSRIEGKGIARVNIVMRRRDGTLWIGGNGGVQRINIDAAGKLQVQEFYRAADGLPSSEVIWLIEDAQGNLWGATEGAGIFRIAAGGFVTYTTTDGLGNDRIASIFEDRSRRLVIQTSWGSSPDFRVLDGDRFKTVPVLHPPAVRYFGWGWNQLSLQARDGDFWIPSGQGVLHYPKLPRLEDVSHTMPQLYDEHSPTGCREVFRVFEDAGGDIWLACMAPKRRLIRWQKSSGRFGIFSAADGWFDEAQALAIRQAPNGTIWVASGSSAFRFRNGRFERYLLNPGKQVPSIKDLMVDRAGRVWIATDYAGLLRCDNADDPQPVFRQYTIREGLSTNSVQTVQEDGAGFIYAGTAVGVDRIDPQAPVESRRVRHFTAADGLPDTQLTTSFRDGRGHLWFGSLHGLSEFDPALLPRHSAPQVYVTRIRVRGEDVPLPWDGAQKVSLDLAPDRNQVEIDYAGIDLGSAGSLHYQYRLVGVDRDWSEPLDRLSVNYASLPTGPYRFEVRAVDADGQMSPQVAGLDLAVAAPLWQRWWFMLFGSLAVAAAGTKIYDYRVSNLLVMERLRTRIATDLHDDIGASLTQISILSELARRSYTPQVLADIANIARAVAQDMSDIVWAVNPRHDRFEGLVHRMRRFASDTLGGAEIDLAFEAEKLPVDFAVPLDARRPLYLVFKEAVNNVARHSGATKASVRLSLDRSWLKLTVEDNGRGFNPAEAQAGEGLASVSRRMRDLEGKATWNSLPGAGTIFTAVLPLRTRTPLPELLGLFRRRRR